MTKDLYIFQNTLGRTKIGVSSNVDDRKSRIELESGIEIDLLNVIPGGEKYERLLHKEYKEYRLFGEWFSLPLPIIKELTLLDLPMLQEKYTLPANENDRTKPNYTMYIPPKLKAQIKSAAKEEGLTMSAYIIESAEKYFKSLK